MITPLSELIDRYSILELKQERLPFSESLWEECEKYRSAIKEYDVSTEVWLFSLKDINGQIWDLEADIRKGKEGQLGLEEVGKRALAIRDLNKKRIEIKNQIADIMGEFEEIKINHASI